MDIRKYQEGDAQGLMELYNETTTRYNLKDLNEEQKRVMIFPDVFFFKQFLIGKICFVLEEENEIKGFITLEDENESLGYIRCLYVDLDEVGKGYGRKLMEFIQNYAKSRGFLKLYLHASRYATRNRTYESLGFEDKGDEDHEIARVMFTSRRMEKSLD